MPLTTDQFRFLNLAIIHDETIDLKWFGAMTSAEADALREYVAIATPELLCHITGDVDALFDVASRIARQDNESVPKVRRSEELLITKLTQDSSEITSLFVANMAKIGMSQAEQELEYSADYFTKTIMILVGFRSWEKA